MLRADVAGVPERLKRFREGDESLIGVEKLTPPPPNATKRQIADFKIAKNRFYVSLRETTQRLQDACRHAIKSMGPEIQDVQECHRNFAEKYGGISATSFDSGTLLLTGHPSGPEESRNHDKEARGLRKRFAKSPHISRLAIEGLSAFQSRTGADDDKLEELFAIETANLILARVLLLRFFEDQGFFGAHKYICNGGIEAFQRMHDYFEVGYTQLLEQAYKHASRLYAAAFDETELDWVFGSNEPGLSRNIEWALFQFSRYDFTTIKGDVLTGVYDRFLDRKKRKELGEFYTPPSVARYIIRRIGIAAGDRVLDPACGSGTFLIEAYRELVGKDVERGAAEYSDVLATLTNLCGNDLNTFSAVLCQIQLLWHVLVFKSEIQESGFPDLPISSKVNSLVLLDQFSALERFGELDVPEYAAVIGNPPYVRKERSAQDLDRASALEFEREKGGFHGISSKLNAYALFTYRALDRWCRPATTSERAGRLGFIVPVSLFDSNETEDLRRLFTVGARWTVLEIIDLELIYRSIFDADVLPAIVICEGRPAREEDTISIRIASKSCVKPSDGGPPEFNFEGLPHETIPYRDVFTPDGRILTRLTSKRDCIIRKLRDNPTLGDVAMPYWVKRHAGVQEWRATPPPVGEERNWDNRRMISRGIVFRATRPALTNRGGPHAIYKGENIIATEIQGEPAISGFDAAQADAPYIWQYESILPEYAYAIAQVAHCANAVLFNPRKLAFTDTATIFIPCAEAAQVPFDLLLLSDIYVWFYALGARMGVLRTCRSHIYPTNLAFLPWCDSFIRVAPEIERLRGRIIRACNEAANASDALVQSLDGLNFQTLKGRLRSDRSSRIVFGDNFDQSDYEAEILGAQRSQGFDDGTRITLSDDLFDFVILNKDDIASGLCRSLNARQGTTLSKAAILSLPVPLTNAENEAWDATVTRFSPEKIHSEKASTLHALNKIVAMALALSVEDLAFIERDCSEDAFLKRIKPRYPGSVTRKQGFRSGLNAASRYE